MNAGAKPTRDTRLPLEDPLSFLNDLARIATEDPELRPMLQRLTATIAERLGIELVALELDPGNTGQPDPATIPPRLAELHEQGVRWVYLGSSSFLSKNATAFTAAAVENGIAVVSPYESMVRDEQALLSIAAREEDVGRLAAEQALKILRDGATPGILPILQATDFAYVVNMEVAHRLDLFPPLAFMQVAEAVKK